MGADILALAEYASIISAVGGLIYGLYWAYKFTSETSTARKNKRSYRKSNFEKLKRRRF